MKEESLICFIIEYHILLAHALEKADATVFLPLEVLGTAPVGRVPV